MRHALAVRRRVPVPSAIAACTVAALCVVASACGSGGSSSSAPAASKTAAKGPVSLEVATDAGGQQILVGSTGRTLYSFDPDTKGGKSVCYGGCAQAWPALTVTGKPVVGPGLDQSLVGMVTRTDGTKQVTYGGWPLYAFAFDKKAGDTNGQGDEQVWWLMTPGGAQIRLPATIQAASSHSYTTDDHGFTLYIYAPDKGGGTSTCASAKCAQEWPPVTTTGAPVAGSGLTGKLGTTKLADGRVEVTLNGWPLHYFAGDTGPGEHNGQGKFGVWWEITPAGAAFEKKGGV